MEILNLNLIDVNKSDISYRVDRYPDGQIQLVLGNLNDNKCELNILTRIKSSDDLFILMQLSDIISRRGIYINKIVITYLLAARTDRVFNQYNAFTLKIVADVINSFNASAVYIFMPHSSRSLQLINYSMPIDIYNYLHDFDDKLWNEDVILVAPDAGAADRLRPYVNTYMDRMITCTKKRDENGAIVSVDLNLDDSSLEISDIDFSKKRLLVMDDLCDGGGTFMALAPELRKLNPMQLDIAVGHAIQHGGIERLSSVYDKVYITDSYDEYDLSSFSRTNVYQLPMVDYLLSEMGYDKRRAK